MIAKYNPASLATVLLTLSLFAGTVAAQQSTGPLGGAQDLASVTPGTFLGEVKNLVSASEARDLLSLGIEGARLALRIEAMQIAFLQDKVCRGNLIPGEYAQEVRLGCQLLDAHAQINQFKQRGLAFLSR